MNAYASVMAMKHMYALRKALKNNDHHAIYWHHALYEEWRVRPEENPTSFVAKVVVREFLESA